MGRSKGGVWKVERVSTPPPLENTSLLNQYCKSTDNNRSRILTQTQFYIPRTHLHPSWYLECFRDPFMHCNIHAETKECTAFVSGEGVSKGELSMTEAFYYNTISFNFLEGGCRIRTQSDYPPPPPLFFLCRLLDREGDEFKKTDQNRACNGCERRHFFC